MHRCSTVPAFGHELKADRVERAVDIPRPYFVFGRPSEKHPTAGVRAEHDDPVRFTAHLNDGRPGRGRYALVKVFQVHGEHSATRHESGVQFAMAVGRLKLNQKHYIPGRLSRHRLLRQIDVPLSARGRI